MGGLECKKPQDQQPTYASTLVLRQFANFLPKIQYDELEVMTQGLLKQAGDGHVAAAQGGASSSSSHIPMGERIKKSGKEVKNDKKEEFNESVLDSLFFNPKKKL